MENDFFEEKRYLKAQKRVKEIKGFYWHLFWYIAVNIFISFGGSIGHIISGGSISELHFNFGMFSVWIFWGIGLFFHWFGVFGRHFTFSKSWEERKIKEFMDKDNFESGLKN